MFGINSAIKLFYTYSYEMIYEAVTSILIRTSVSQQNITFLTLF